MSALYNFLSGGIMMACWTAGVFFFHFWKKTNDSLFIIFALAFWILAVERCVLAFLQINTGEDAVAVYLLRLAAFILILAGIANKNRSDKSKTSV